MARDYESEGRRAFEQGKPANSNPYRYGTPFYSWSNGWTDAWWQSPAGQAEAARLHALDSAHQEGVNLATQGREG